MMKIRRVKIKEDNRERKSDIKVESNEEIKR